jgi:four helix bundle protein
MMRTKPHKKLDVWKKSLALVEETYRLVINLPRSEEFGITNQMKRSAVSITANIAEGAGRQTKKEFIQFLHVAQGSLSELDTHLEILDRIGYLHGNVPDRIIYLMNDIDRMLTGLIQSLRKKP